VTCRVARLSQDHLRMDLVFCCELNIESAPSAGAYVTTQFPLVRIFE